MDPPRRSPRQMLRDRHQSKPRPSRIGDRVDHHRATRAKNSTDLTNDRLDIDDMLEDLTRDNNISAAGLQREPRNIRPHRNHAAQAGNFQGGLDKIHANVKIRDHVTISEKTTATTDINQQLTGPSRFRNEFPSRHRKPVQRRELAVRPYPLTHEIVILTNIVPWPNTSSKPLSCAGQSIIPVNRNRAVEHEPAFPLQTPINTLMTADPIQALLRPGVAPSREGSARKSVAGPTRSDPDRPAASARSRSTTSSIAGDPASNRPVRPWRFITQSVHLDDGSVGHQWALSAGHRQTYVPYQGGVLLVASLGGYRTKTARRVPTFVCEPQASDQS